MSQEQLLDPFNVLFASLQQDLVAFLPRLMGALVVLLAGLALAWLLRFLSRRLIESLDRLVPGGRLQRSFGHFGAQRPASEVVSQVFFWLVVLLFFSLATEALGLPVLTAWFKGIARYLPKFFSAVLVVFAGLIGGYFLRNLVVTAATSAGVGYAGTLGRLVQTVVVLIGLLVAVEQVGLNIAFVTDGLLVVLGVLMLGGALSFALGARTTVANILAAHYLQKTYKVGHRVEIGELQGEIVQISPTAVILETATGRATVPAQLFGEVVSILLIERT